ncbi:MAG TPA: type II toxin-antitoxin system VapC family toxin [Dehalococcoidia bacterium]|nr:type II toxin-antitoxin system VapC family toxin [Dehalococcoidia bacterium]
MPFVIDASLTLAWCFEDETTPYAEATLEKLKQTSALVPTIWPLEVVNALLVAERRRRILQAQSLHFLELLGQLPVEVSAEGIEEAFSWALALAREHSLSAYDASYLELAAREGLPLATQDTELRAAAVKAGVPLLE